MAGLPELIVIGAQKCATTSLWGALDQHPDITMAAGKETQFFLWHHAQGEAFYEGRFDKSARVRGESCPDYTALPFSEGVAERIKAMVPHARLVYLVRNPVDRVVSHWLHASERGRDPRPLAEVVARDDFGDTEYAQRSRYWWQLEPFLREFGDERVLILLQEDLRHRGPEVLEEVFRFAGVDPAAAPPDAGTTQLHLSDVKKQPPALVARAILGRRTATSPPPRAWQANAVKWATERFGSPVERPEVDDATRERIVDHVREDVRALSAHLGRPLWGIA